MQKVIIDTNVLVSSLIQKSYPFKIVYYLFFDNKMELCISDDLMKEYYDVLTRPKFSKFQDFFIRAKNVLVAVESFSTHYHPSTKVDLITDKDDNMMLELAEESNADFIITGNTNDFTFPSYKTTKIVSPKEYWENYRPK